MQPYSLESYFAMTLDPVHVGTGGYRLGHVDNTIIRENATRLPKIPGSSLNGVLRSYTAMVIQGDATVDDVIAEKDGHIVVDCKKYHQKLKYLRPVFIPINGEDASIATEDKFIGNVQKFWHGPVCT